MLSSMYIFHQSIFILVYAHKVSHRLPILNAASMTLILKLFGHALVFCLFGFFSVCFGVFIFSLSYGLLAKNRFSVSLFKTI